MKSWVVGAGQAVLAALLGCMPLGVGALGQTTARDVQVVGRVAGFVSPRPTGTVPVAIVFDPGNAASKAEADLVAQTIGSGLKAGSITLTGTQVPAAGDRLDFSNFRVVIVVSRMSARYAEIAAAAAAAKSLTVSSDPDCVASGTCVAGIRSQPGVEITINQTAAERTGIGFDGAFRLMIKLI